MWISYCNNPYLMANVILYEGFQKFVKYWNIMWQNLNCTVWAILRLYHNVRYCIELLLNQHDMDYSWLTSLCQMARPCQSMAFDRTGDHVITYQQVGKQIYFV